MSLDSLTVFIFSFGKSEKTDKKSVSILFFFLVHLFPIAFSYNYQSLHRFFFSPQKRNGCSSLVQKCLQEMFEVSQARIVWINGKWVEFSSHKSVFFYFSNSFSLHHLSIFLASSISISHFLSPPSSFFFLLDLYSSFYFPSISFTWSAFAILPFVRSLPFQQFSHSVAPFYCMSESLLPFLLHQEKILEHNGILLLTSSPDAFCLHFCFLRLVVVAVVSVSMVVLPLWLFFLFATRNRLHISA